MIHIEQQQPCPLWTHLICLARNKHWNETVVEGNRKRQIVVMSGWEPQQQSWPSVNHRLNEPGALPPDALWPRLGDAGRAVISQFSMDAETKTRLPVTASRTRWKPVARKPTRWAWTVTETSVKRTNSVSYTCKHCEIHEWSLCFAGHVYGHACRQSRWRASHVSGVGYRFHTKTIWGPAQKTLSFTNQLLSGHFHCLSVDTKLLPLKKAHTLSDIVAGTVQTLNSRLWCPQWLPLCPRSHGGSSRWSCSLSLASQQLLLWEKLLMLMQILLCC